MKAWDEIATAALIGTERGSFAPPRGAGAVGEALVRVPGESAESRLLGCAAVVDGCGRAGFVPWESQGAALPSPAENETVPACSPKAEQLLLRLLERAEEALIQWREDLLREWLYLAGQAGKRLPPAALPALLEEGISKVEWRERIQPLLGRRGAWLAGQNPAWVWALRDDAEETSTAAWEEGTPAERKAWLRRLREKDPKQARERLEAVWKQEPAQSRAAFLEQLGTGLSMADEPFLEAALDDKSKEVRRVAVELLSSLPEARFAGRMIERASALIQFSRGLLGGVKMKVELPPEEPEAAWKRDGLEKETNGIAGGLGTRALLLKKIVSAIPLDYWTAQAKLPPAELIDNARKTEWSEAIVGGWAEAARRQRSAAWCLALLDKVRSKKNEYDEREVLNGLEKSERERFITRRIQGLKPIDRISPLYHFLVAVNIELGPELTRAALAGLREGMTSKSSYDYYKAELLMAVADRGSPALYPEAEALTRAVNAERSEWNRTLEKFLVLYDFRHAMHKELNP